MVNLSNGMSTSRILALRLGKLRLTPVLTFSEVNLFQGGFTDDRVTKDAYGVSKRRASEISILTEDSIVAVKVTLEL